MLPSAAEIVARFLRANNYTETLSAFLQEAKLPPDAGSAGPGDVTIEKILQEKKTFDLSVNFEKLGIGEEDRGWKSPAPCSPTMLQLPSASNILSTSIENILLPGMDAPRPCIMVTTADRRLHCLSAESRYHEVLRTFESIQDSPILSYTVLQSRYLICGSMSGKVVLYDCKECVVLDDRRDHLKYVVKIAHWQEGDDILVATAGWDSKINVYSMQACGDRPLALQEPMATTDLFSIPECVVFTRHPDASMPLLIMTRRDSTFLYYYSLPSLAGGAKRQLRLVGKQNLSPYSNAWVAFTPAFVAVNPMDSSIAAVATSSIPSMKIIIVRLLLPPPHVVGSESSNPVETQQVTTGEEGGPELSHAAQARAELAIQDKEAAAILVHATTHAAQTPYSTPALCWRPDGSGIWVNGDDGLVRGIETSTGKVVSSLRGHEAGAKIRCVWAGASDQDGKAKQEILLSGGFDQQLILWAVQAAVN